MRKIMLALILSCFAVGLSACKEVEGFYADRCKDIGGTWSSAGTGKCDAELF